MLRSSARTVLFFCLLWGFGCTSESETTEIEDMVDVNNDVGLE